MLVHAVWDVFQACCVAAVSLVLFARQRNEALTQGASLEASLRAIRDEAAADPLEAFSACFTNFFLISMCGNSPVAWAAAIAFASVDEKMFGEFRDRIVARWGDPYDGHSAYIFGLCAFACFVVPYIVHGLLLLPLELWSPAVDAAFLSPPSSHHCS